MASWKGSDLPNERENNEKIVRALGGQEAVDRLNASYDSPHVKRNPKEFQPSEPQDYAKNITDNELTPWELAARNSNSGGGSVEDGGSPNGTNSNEDAGRDSLQREFSGPRQSRDDKEKNRDDGFDLSR